mgnify:CR=1 FL=1
MLSIISKIAFPIIISGIFITVVFVATGYEGIGLNLYIVFSTVTVFVFLFGFSISNS